jgi:pyruvate dehydrogenase E2 component (dihydrolipoamide acetyltransferase)
MALIEVKVPDIGDFKEVEVIELLVKPGDTVAAEQSLVTVESDKASMEIPSSHAGVVKELKIALGDKVAEGSVLLVLEGEGSGEGTGATGGDGGDGGSPAPSPQPSPAGETEGDAGAGTHSAAAADAPASAPASESASATSPAPAPAPQGGSGGGGAAVTVEVPDIGDFKEVEVIELLVKPGDRVEAEQSLITVESDKASMEIPCSQAGIVETVLVKVGDKVSKGTPLVTLKAEGSTAGAPAPQSSPASGRAGESAPAPAPGGKGSETAADAAKGGQAPSPSPSPVPRAQAGSEAAAPAATTPGTLPHASPSIRKRARELGVPLAEVAGSGPKGRITEADLQAFVKSVMAGEVQTGAQKAKAPPAAAAAPVPAGGGIPGLLAWPQVDFSKFGPVERKPLSRIKKISGANLHRNWVLIPHVTNHDDADITDLEAFRVQLNKENEKSGVKVTMLAFMIKAAVAALKKFPEFNASLDGEELVLKNYFHIGFAADTPNGLVVPVIKDADKKGIFQISTEMGELAKKARDGKLGPADMSGGCFSISSLGGIGGRYFTPIINAPEVAIMGVCRSSTEPRWDGKQFAPRLILPLSLSWDHRVIDGAAAARFNVYFASLLADFRRIAL